METDTCAAPKNRHSKLKLEKTVNHNIIQPISQKATTYKITKATEGATVKPKSVDSIIVYL